MKILRAIWHAYRLPYHRTIAWSDTVEDAANYLLLELTDEQGRTGLAEVALKATWSGASVRSVSAALEDMLLPLVLNRSFEDAQAIRQRLGVVPENSAAKALVGSAAELLFLQRQSGLVPIDIPMSWAVTRASAREMAQEAERMVHQHGFGTLKVKGGQGFDTDREVLRSIRSAVGANVALTVDANWAYERRDMAAYVQGMAEEGAVCVEDPAPLAPDEAFQQAVANAPVPVLVDFACASARDAQLFLQRGARALSVKPGRYGLPEGQCIAELARDAGARTCIGLFGESALGTLVSLQAARRQPQLTAFLPAETSFFLMLKDQVLGAAPEVQGGMLRLPAPADLAGLVDRDKLRRYAL